MTWSSVSWALPESSSGRGTEGLAKGDGHFHRSTADGEDAPTYHVPRHAASTTGARKP